MRLSDHRARALIDTAANEFLAHGYRHGSVDNVAFATGVAKATIYRHFGDKNGLFRAAVQHAVDQLVTPSADLAGRSGPAEQVLAEFARESLDLYLRDRSIALHRTVIEAGHQFPELAHLVRERLTDWSRDTLTAYLRGMAEGGAIEIADVDWAAHQFINLATHGIMFLMIPSPATDAERQALSEEAVALFLGGVSSMRGRL